MMMDYYAFSVHASIVDQQQINIQLRFPYKYVLYKKTSVQYSEPHYAQRVSRKWIIIIKGYV